MVESFGRPAEEQEPAGEPVVVLPPARMPVVLVMDVATLAAVADQLTTMVSKAVQSGFADAFMNLELDAVGDSPKPVGFDGP